MAYFVTTSFQYNLYTLYIYFTECLLYRGLITDYCIRYLVCSGWDGVWGVCNIKWHHL